MPETAAGPVLRLDHKGAALVPVHRRGDKVGLTAQQLDPALVVREMQRDGARGAQLDAAAVGKRNALVRAGRRAVIGHQQRDRIAQPDRPHGDQQQACRQRSRRGPDPTPSGPLHRRPRRPAHGLSGNDIFRQRTGRRAQLAHFAPGGLRLVERGGMRRAFAEPTVERPALRVAQATAAQAGRPGRGNRIDLVLSVFRFVHVLDEAPDRCPVRRTASIDNGVHRVGRRSGLDPVIGWESFGLT